MTKILATIAVLLALAVAVVYGHRAFKAANTLSREAATPAVPQPVAAPSPPHAETAAAPAAQPPPPAPSALQRLLAGEEIKEAAPGASSVHTPEPATALEKLLRGQAIPEGKHNEK